MAISRSDIKRSFLLRIVHSLGYGSLLDLTLASGIPHQDLKALERGSRGQTEIIEDSETWQAVLAHADLRLAQIMAAREELQRKLSIERRKRQERREAILCR